MTATLVSYLSGSERLEDRDDPRDATLGRPVVNRIERAIIDALATADVTEIVLSSAGGFQVVNSLVRELVQLHAGSRTVRDLEIKDASRSTGDGIDRAHERQAPTDPIAVVAAKRHALALIENGNLIAAWGAVAHLDGDPACQSWIKVLRWLYQWASSMPVEAECDLPLPTTSQRAANAAMRVELALRCGDLPKAIQGTVAFFEAAVWDHLYSRHIEELHPSGPDAKLRFRVTPAPTDDSRVMKRIAGQGDEYEIKNFGKHSQEITKKYLHVHGQIQCDALRVFSDTFTIAFHLRNLVAHGEPTRERTKWAADQMTHHKYWPANRRFLSHLPIQKVLQELGVAEPSLLCDVLMREVGTRLRERTP